MHIIEIMKFFNVPVRIGRIKTDSSACIGMASRLGVGRVRHIETRVSWLQEVIAKSLLLSEKCDSDDNLADMGTKALMAERHEHLTKLLGMKNLSDEEETSVRAILAPDIVNGKGKGGVSKKVLIALGVLLQTIGSDGKRQVKENNDSGYLTWIQIVTVFMFIFVCGMVVGSYLTVRVVRWMGLMTTQMGQAAVPPAPVAPTASVAAGSTPTVMRARVTTRTMATQSQTTYTWWHQQPRVKVNFEGTEGAWAQMP